MKKYNVSVLSQHLLLLKILLLLGMAVGDPRTKMVQIMCGNQREHNTTMFVPNLSARWITSVNKCKLPASEWQSLVQARTPTTA
ncbi:hypothetical protein ACFX15_011227 [Malus domestica]